MALCAAAEGVRGALFSGWQEKHLPSSLQSPQGAPGLHSGQSVHRQEVLQNSVQPGVGQELWEAPGKCSMPHWKQKCAPQRVQPVPGEMLQRRQGAGVRKVCVEGGKGWEPAFYCTHTLPSHALPAPLTGGSGAPWAC